MNQDMRRGENRAATGGSIGPAHEAGSLFCTGYSRRTEQDRAAVGFLTATWGLGVTLHGFADPGKGYI